MLYGFTLLRSLTSVTRVRLPLGSPSSGIGTASLEWNDLPIRSRRRLGNQTEIPSEMSSGEPMRRKVFSPARLGMLELRNRVIKTATYEGMSPGGMPSNALIRHHQDLATGGVGMTTVAYCAVSPDGRTFEAQMYMREAIVPKLRELTGAVHARGAAVSIQLGHCGYFSRNTTLPRTALAGAVVPIQRVRPDVGRAVRPSDDARPTSPP